MSGARTERGTPEWSAAEARVVLRAARLVSGADMFDLPVVGVVVRPDPTMPGRLLLVNGSGRYRVMLETVGHLPYGLEVSRLLTADQAAAVVGLGRGESAGRAAARLGVKPGSVEDMRLRAYRALGVSRAAHAVGVLLGLSDV